MSRLTVPRGVYLNAWLAFGALVVVGFVVADVVDGWAWAVYAVVVFVAFWAIEAPGLTTPDNRGTLTYHLQYAYGVTPRGHLLGFVTLAIVAGLIFAQVRKAIGAGIPASAASVAGLLAVAWLYDHFLAPDSRIWRWRALRRARREG